MSTDPIDELTRIAGESVRAVVRYGEDGIDVVEMTETARNGPDPETKLRVLSRVTGEEFPADPFGPRQSTVHSFREVTVVALPTGPETGVIATLDPNVPGEKLGRLLVAAPNLPSGNRADTPE